MHARIVVQQIYSTYRREWNSGAIVEVAFVVATTVTNRLRRGRAVGVGPIPAIPANNV